MARAQQRVSALDAELQGLHVHLLVALASCTLERHRGDKEMLTENVVCNEVLTSRDCLT